MAEIDYIERRKLWDEVVKSKTNNPHLNEIQRQAHIHEHRTFQRMIIEQPAADVVEVVRCKDCKYWVEEKDFGMFCSHWGSTLAESQADDFCSYGERKIETDNTYFTPEDVVKMSEAEVKENYQTIMKSMDKWGGKDT